ncbi:hypothetical protein LX97_01061 [Nonlabens dokdonensis]|uniref:Uncharacterized protein n=2 Tax=Nonlabens dokdonensis TaxID=328515 RepID=L7W477_NONDD|nr:hypothetical protein [Nonlabens dokdonensis]AGC76395.1 hypothetical protein DDD_1268 [Nonlabens dokdonensis DSW-6]PZX44053.1 hypothetical protein LX97_01061 [Nonlabens dokdonensis]
MKNKFLLFLLFFLVNTLFIDAQNNYGVTFDKDENPDNCSNYNRMMSTKAKEIGFNIERKGNSLFLRVTDKEWFESVLKNKTDGIAVDVIPRDNYLCGVELPDTQIRGTLLKPVYKAKLLQGLKKKGSNSWLTLVGRVPENLKDKDLEFNILFLGNKTMCGYYNIYNLESFPWNLLDMGIYLDELKYKNDGAIAEKETTEKKFKTLNFTIPFEKNKSQYYPEDVKPIYDSLNLTDYKISKIKINAYASVEGSKEINERLQKERGNSIVNSLKSYTKNDVITEVVTSENWAEFFESIQGTENANLAQLSKQEIKEKLVGTLSAELEPVLAQHRKGIVTIELSKIVRYKGMSNQELVSTFNSTLKKGDFENAMILQKALFDRALKASDPSLLAKMEIPQQKKYADFNNNKAVFGYYQDASQALTAKRELEEVLEVAPKNKKVRYNITAIDIYLYRYDFEGLKERDLKVQIRGLKMYGINNKLILRMLTNMDIIKAEKKRREKKYKEKDAAVKSIKYTYKLIELSNSDYLSLAQFLTYYDNVESSKALLYPVVSKVDANEDLLFYYINQTIVSNTMVAQNDYRVILSNAYGQNPERFCQLFNASTKEGVTFQLLKNTYLRSSFCENCN